MSESNMILSPTTPDQQKRFASGMKAACTPLELFPADRRGTFSGGHGVYHTTLEDCDCVDFHVRRQPCKHMYRLAVELGVLEGTAVSDKTKIESPGLKKKQRLALLEAAVDKLEQVEQMLGRPYSILGRVVHGNELGRTIGFPTANIGLHRNVNPIQGVYAVEVKDKANHHYYGVANVGNRPTINGFKPLLEVHLFDFNGDLYGQTLEIFFKLKLRSEIKFPSFAALQQQIKLDAENAKRYFQQNRQK